MLGKNLGGGAQALQNLCYCLVVKSCPTLFDPMECSPLQAPLFMDFPGKNARVGFHFLLQGIFLTQGSNPSLLLDRGIFYHCVIKKAHMTKQSYYWAYTLKKP